MLTRISVHGARQHNLKNIDVEIPRNTFTVITGLSGSGKSSLAFDTIYAEGQRRYVETLSPYARQFLDQMESQFPRHGIVARHVGLVVLRASTLPVLGGFGRKVERGVADARAAIHEERRHVVLEVLLALVVADHDERVGRAATLRRDKTAHSDERGDLLDTRARHRVVEEAW